MYMRVTRFRQDAAKFDQTVPVVLETAEAVKQLPGCESMAVVGDRSAGEGFAISTWDTEDHARFSRDALLVGATGRLQAVGVQLDPPLVFEVLG